MSARKLPAKSAMTEKPLKLFVVFAASTFASGYSAHATVVAARSRRIAIKAGLDQFQWSNSDNWAFKTDAFEVEKGMIDLVAGGPR